MTPPQLAIVTGGAHRLGKAFALLLARRGFSICLHYWKSEDQARSTAEELKALGSQVLLCRADLTDPAGIDAAFSIVERSGLPLRVLVNSAAVLRTEDPRTMSLTDWDATLNLNLRAPFLCSKWAAQRMQSGGLIVNITDVGARKSWSRFPAYSVSKAGLEALTRILARAYAPGIRVNAIAPGLILPAEGMPVAEWERLIGRLPLARPGRLEEIAAALEFLLTNEYVTGQTLAVDGGYSLLG